MLTIADLNRQEEERKRKERERIEAERRKAEAEASRKAAQQSAQSQPKVTAAKPTPVTGQPVKKEVPKKTGEVFKPSMPSNAYYDPKSAQGAGIASYRKKGLAPVHTDTIFPVTQKNPAEMNWAERAALGQLTNGQGLGHDYFKQLSDAVQNPGSGMTFDPYYGNKSTLQEAIDFFGRENFDQKWLDETAPLQVYENRLPDTLNISKAGQKKWTYEQRAAYYRNIIEMHEAETQQAEKQWASLIANSQDYFKSFQTNHGRAPSIDEFWGSIDMTNYPMLQKMDDSRNIGSAGSSSPVILNRGIGYSKEKVYGIYDALQHQQDVDPTQDYTQNAIEYFKRWSPSAPVTKSTGSGYKWETNIAAMTPEDIEKTRKEIRTSGSRSEDAAFTQALYTRGKPGYDSMDVSPYHDDAYFDAMDEKWLPLITANSEYDVNGQLKMKSPGKDAPYSLQVAYKYWQERQKRPETDDLEQQWRDARGELAAYYEEHKGDPGFTPEKLVKYLDLTKYSLLDKYMDRTGAVEPVRPVYATREALQGAAKALFAGVDISSDEVDYALLGANAKVTGYDPTYSDREGYTPATDPTRGLPTAQPLTPPVAASATPEPTPSPTLNPNATPTPAPTAPIEPQPAPAPDEDGFTDKYKVNMDAIDQSIDTTGRVDLRTAPEELRPFLINAGLADSAQLDAMEEQAKQNADPEYTGMTKGSFKAQAGTGNTKGLSLDQLHTYKDYLEGQLKLLDDDAQKDTVDVPAIQGKIDKLELTLANGGDPETINPQLQELYAQRDGMVGNADEQAAREAVRFNLQNELESVTQGIGELTLKTGGAQAKYDSRGGGNKSGAWLGSDKTIFNQKEMGVQLPAWKQTGQQLEQYGMSAGIIPQLQHQREYISQQAFDYIAGKHPELSPEQAQEEANRFIQEGIQAGVDSLDENAYSSAMQLLGPGAPQWATNLVAGVLTNAVVIPQNMVNSLDATHAWTLGALADGWQKMNEGYYKAQLGENYTFDQARALDPTLDSLAGAADRVDATGDAFHGDYSKVNFGGAIVAPITESVTDQITMSMMTGGMKGIMGNTAAKVVKAASPYMEGLPAAIKAAPKVVGKVAEYMATNFHYFTRSYVQYADEARDLGIPENQVNVYALYGAMTEGFIESVLGGRYEKVFTGASNVMSTLTKKAIKGAAPVLEKIGGGLFNFLKMSIPTSLGEAAEEGTQNITDAIGRQVILGQQQDWSSWGDFFKDITDGDGQGYDPTKYADTMVGQTFQSALMGGASSFVTSLLFGIGGAAGGHAEQQKATQLYDQLSKSGDSAAIMREAAARMVYEESGLSKAAPIDVVAPPAQPEGSEAAPVTGVPTGATEVAPVDDLAAQRKQRSADGVSPLAQKVLEYADQMRPQVEQALIDMEAEARTNDDIVNGAMAEFDSPTNASVQAIARIQNNIDFAMKTADDVAEQIKDAKRRLKQLIDTAVKNNIPTDSGPTFQGIGNLNSSIGAQEKDQAKAQEKVDKANADLKLATEKQDAEKQAARDQIKAGHVDAITKETQQQLERRRAEEDEIKQRIGAELTRYELRQAKARGFKTNVLKNEQQLDSQALNAPDSAEYIDSLTTAPGQDIKQIMRDYEAHDENGSGQSSEKEPELDSMAEMKRQNYKDRTNTVDPTDQENVASQRDNISGAPLGPDGKTMIEVSRKIYNDMFKKAKDLGLFTMDGFQRKASKGSNYEYGKALTERGYSEEAAPTELRTVNGKQYKVTKETLVQDQTKSAEETATPQMRTWKKQGFSNVGGSADYILLKDNNFERDNAEVLADIKLHESLRGKTKRDVDKMIQDAKAMLTPRFYVVRKDSEEYDAARASEFSSVEKADALKYINERTGKPLLPTDTTGEMTYYISRSTLYKLDKDLAKAIASEDEIMDYEEKAAKVRENVSAYAKENNLDAKEENELQGALALYTKAGKPGYVVKDSNQKYVLLLRPEDSFANSRVSNLADAMAILKEAIGVQQNHRTWKKSDGTWGHRQYHDQEYMNQRTNTSIRNVDDTVKELGEWDSEAKKRVQKSYIREGDIIFSYIDKSGKKRTMKFGAPKASKDDRYFATFEQVLNNAFTIDVNYYDSKKQRQSFTIERNVGQDAYAIYDSENVAAEQDPETIKRNVMRDITRFVEWISDPTVAATSRQKFAVNALTAMIKDVRSKIDTATAQLNPKKPDPKISKEIATMTASAQTMKGMLTSISGADPEAARAQYGSFVSLFNQLYVNDPLMDQITYKGQDEDLNAMARIAELSKTATQNQQKVIASALVNLRKKINSGITEAQVNIGGGELLGIINERVKSLTNDLVRLREAVDGSLERTAKPSLRNAMVKTIMTDLKYYVGYRDKLVAAGVTASTPSKLQPVDNGAFKYSLDGMSYGDIRELKKETEAYLTQAQRDVDRKTDVDLKQVGNTRKLLSEIDGVIKDSAMREAIEAVKTEKLPGESEGKIPAAVTEPKFITPRSKDDQDSYKYTQDGENLIFKLYNKRLADMTHDEAVFYFHTFGLDAQRIARRFSQYEFANMPESLTGAIHAAESLLLDQAQKGGKGYGPVMPYSGKTPAGTLPVQEQPVEALGEPTTAEAAPEEQTPVQPENPVQVHPVAAKAIDEAPVTEEAKTDLKDRAEDVAVAMAAPSYTEYADAQDVGYYPPSGNEPPTAEEPENQDNISMPAFSRIADESIAKGEDLPMPFKANEPKSALLDRIRAITKESTTTEPQNIIPVNPEIKNPVTRISRDEVRLHKLGDPLSFEVNDPKTVVDFSILDQMRVKTGQQIGEMNAQMNEILDASKAKGIDMAEKQKLLNDFESLKKRRDKFRAKMRQIKTALGTEEAQSIGKVAEAVEFARRYGANAPEATQYGAIQKALAHPGVERLEEVLKDAKFYERMKMSTRSVIKFFDDGSILPNIAHSLDVANATMADCHRAEDRLDLVNATLERLDDQLIGAEGKEAMIANANRGFYMKVRENLMTEIENLRAGADVHYRNSAYNLYDAVFGEERSGRLPTDMMAKTIAVIAEACKDHSKNLTALPKYVWKITNDALETNSKRLMETYTGKFAPILNALFIDPVIKSNTKKAVEAETLYDKIRASGITRENSAIAHLYAENVISKAELMAQRPNDYKEILKGIGVMRGIYAQVYAEVNEALTRNGFPPVPERKNYFPHFREGANPILAMLGLVENEDTLPIDIVGKTGEFKPSKQFVGNFLARTGDTTDYGLLEGAVRYLNGALQVIHQTDNIVRLRQLEEFMGNTGKLGNVRQDNNFANFKLMMMNYTNALAGKKSPLDRVAENFIKRQGLDVLRNVKMLRGLAMTAYNVKVALAQVVGLGQSFGLAPAHTAIAFAETLNNAKNAHNFDFMRAFENDSSYLTRKYKGKPIPITALQVFAEKGQITAETLERITSYLFVRSAYLQGRGKKLSHEAALEYADEMAYRMLSSRLKGESGIEYSSVVGGVALQFTREAMNNWWTLIKDVPRHTLGKGLPFLLITCLYNWFIDWATGSDIALNPIGQTKAAIDNREEGENPFTTAWNAISGTFNTGWPISYDFVNGAANVPVASGVRNIYNAVANFSIQDPTAYERILSAAMGFVPGGSQIERTYRGIKANVLGYSQSNKGDVRFPLDRSPDDIIFAPLFGDLFTAEGRQYKDAGSKPLTKTQGAQFAGQVQAGMSTTEAYRNVTGTEEATLATNDTAKLSRLGERTASKEMGAQASNLRGGISLPAETPQWGVQLYNDKDPVLTRVAELWQSSGTLNVLPKKIPNSIQQGGKQLMLDTDEIRAEYEAEYAKNYKAALRFLLKNNPDASADEIAKAADRASRQTIGLFLDEHWTQKD